MTAVSLLFVGNPGGGKSFLSNVVLSEDKFTHDRSGLPVTTSHEEASVTLPFNGQPRLVTVHNVPGMIHPGDSAETEKNKLVIAEAFSQPGEHIIGYCFAVGAGGRLVDQDYNVYTALKNAYDLQTTAVLFIFNKLDPLRSVSQDSKLILQAKTVLDWPAGTPLHAVFLDDVQQNVSDFSDNNRALDDVKSRLFAGLQRLSPIRHEKKKEIQLANEAELKALHDKITEAEKQATTSQAQVEALNTQMQTQKDEMDKLKQGGGGDSFWDKAGKLVTSVGKTVFPFLG